MPLTLLYHLLYFIITFQSRPRKKNQSNSFLFQLELQGLGSYQWLEILHLEWELKHIMVFGDTFIHKNCVQKRSKWIIQLRFSHELVTTKRILLTWRYLLPFVKWPVTIKVYTLYLKLNDVWMTLWVFMQTLPYISQLLSLFRVPSQDKGMKAQQPSRAKELSLWRLQSINSSKHLSRF